MEFRKYIIYSCFLISFIAFSSCDKDEPINDTFASDLVGTWIYTWNYYQDGNAYPQTKTYIFDNNGRGCGPYVDSSYDFSYEIVNEDNGYHTITIRYDYDNEIVSFKNVMIVDNSLRLNNNLYKRQ